jgi:hypothetical protein
MLSSAVLPRMRARRAITIWRMPVQAKLYFMVDRRVPQTSICDPLDEEQKNAVIEVLAGLIARVIVAEQQSGAKQDG